jgi:hypothetical protein
MRERLLHYNLDSKRIHVVMNLPDPKIFALGRIQGGCQN